MLPSFSSASSSSVSPKRSSPRTLGGPLFPSSKHARKKLVRLAGLFLGTLLGILLGLKLVSDARRDGMTELENAGRKRPQLAPFGGAQRDELDDLLRGGTKATNKGYQEIVFVDPRPGYEAHPTRPGDERYLAYLPHSGYHNQRIALTNALLLSHHLNRTLLLPPLILGTPVPKREPTKHHKTLRTLISSRSRLADVCPALIATSKPITAECEGYEDRTLLSWEAMIDLQAARARGFKYLEWWSLDEDWLDNELAIDATEIKRFWTAKRYDYEIHLSSKVDPDSSPSAPFETRLNVDTDLAPIEERVLMFASLFGSKRLVLDGASREDREMERGLKQDVALKMGVLARAVEAGRKVMDGGKGIGTDGNGYLGLHLRLNERIFGWDAARNTRQTFFTLLHTHLHLPLALIETLDRTTWSKSRQYRELVLAPSPPPEGTPWDGIGPVLTPLSDRSRTPVQPYPAPPDVAPPTSEERIPALKGTTDPPYPPQTPSHPERPPIHCRRPLHTDPDLLSLNIPLYISTDTTTPLTHPALTPFLTHFPCVFFLSDLPSNSAVDALKGLKNRDDGVGLWKFMVPFLDGLVAAGGRRVLGTPKSTFSAYVVGVEWRKVWGLGDEGEMEKRPER